MVMAAVRVELSVKKYVELLCLAAVIGSCEMDSRTPASLSTNLNGLMKKRI